MNEMCVRSVGGMILTGETPVHLPVRQFSRQYHLSNASYFIHLLYSLPGPVEESKYTS